MSKVHESRPVLEKNMSPLSIWALAFGAIIGWGAFIMPGLRFLPGSGPIGACIGFVCGGLLLMFIAVSYGKVVGLYPVAGGVFAFAYAAFGPGLAFIGGWALLLGYLCIIALNGTAIVLLTRFLIPGVLELGYMYSIAEWKIYFGELLFLEAVLALFWYLNYRGADIVSRVQVVLAVILAIGVLSLLVGAVISPTSNWQNIEPWFAQDKSVIASIAAVTAIAPWLFVGFDTIPQAAEEFNFSAKTGVRLMLLSIVCGIVTYSIITLAVAAVIPYPELLALNPVWHTGYTVSVSLGKVGSVVLALAVFSAILTGINGFFIASSRLMFSMGRAHILPVWFASLHGKHKTPHNALNFTLVVVAIAPFFGREVLSWVVDMSSIGTIIAYFFASAAAFVIMRNHETPCNISGILGCVASLICLGLLTLPMSPASIGPESWHVLVAWSVLGVCFYIVRYKAVHAISEEERTYMILGESDLKNHVTQRTTQKPDQLVA
ncbi:APC family permease [uncultured Desulfovibrio sp.]|uniref:APC family permease n=1 Tax=uncultured Desulfovibrio sp. TaxID=167968 RepID=UPI00262335F2|nr:APC family permease [uncultured Desulfovibrio sp.]